MFLPITTRVTGNYLKLYFIWYVVMITFLNEIMNDEKILTTDDNFSRVIFILRTIVLSKQSCIIIGVSELEGTKQNLEMLFKLLKF